MKHAYVFLRPATQTLLWSWLVFGLLTGTARAQAPAWGGAVFGTATAGPDQSLVQALATDASGNIFVTGTFVGTVTFGTSSLTAQGNGDVFVAKYAPNTGTWAWALSAGGTDMDGGTGLAVVGNSVYVLGTFTNSSADANGVRFQTVGSATGTIVQGATAATSPDIFLAKYVDQGSSATLAWTQVAGGTTADYSYNLAASGSNLYVATSIQNNTLDANGVLFGGTGNQPGTVTVRGATPSTTLDVCVAKYVDQGTSASLAWTQVGGGTNQDYASGVAVSGTNVYVTASLWNNQANANQVLFGGNGTSVGTTTVRGASATASSDLLLAKYTDAGASATLGWVQVSGGTSFDVAGGVATSGSSVYVTGNIRSDVANSTAVLFGGNGTTAGTTSVRGVAASASPDLVLAKYTDNGRSASLGWVQVGGGSAQDSGQSIGVSGANLYVTGSSVNNAANTNQVLFGGNGTSAGTVAVPGASSVQTNDLLLAKYTDLGTSASLAWVQVGGGAGSDVGRSVAVSGQRVYAAGNAAVPGLFGSIATAGPTGTTSAVVAYVPDVTLVPLATRAGSGSMALRAFPNPATGYTTLTGGAPGAAVEVLDGVGRRVQTAMLGADGTTTFTLPMGFYFVRSGAYVTRVVMQ